MKFAKGILSNEEEEEKVGGAGTVNLAERMLDHVERPDALVPKEKRFPEQIVVEKNRLFQTVDESSRSGRKYLVLLMVVCLITAIAGSAAWYAMRPAVGDRITTPRGLELAVRNHFLEKEKREATDIAFYQCEGFNWARVGVTTRTDMPNPLWRVGTFSARTVAEGETWTITASPAPEPEKLVPCS